MPLPDRERRFAQQVGFDDVRDALAFLEDWLKLPYSPCLVDAPAGMDGAGEAWPDGFALEYVTPFLVAVRVAGLLDHSLSRLPPTTLLLPPFLSPRSVSAGWVQFEHDVGHIHYLLDVAGQRVGRGILVDWTGGPRWFLGRTLSEAARAHQQAQARFGDR